MQDSLFSAIVRLIAVFAIFYFLIIPHEQQRVKELKDLVGNLRRGDTVVTAGGRRGPHGQAAAA